MPYLAAIATKEWCFKEERVPNTTLLEFCIFMPECQSSLVSKVGNRESIAVILKRFDALSPAALENCLCVRLFTSLSVTSCGPITVAKRM